MAITGTKLFASGDVLTAADTNQYLMRGVKVYSSTAVRDAAYGGAGEPTLEEGETCYITGTDTLQIYNGSTWQDYPTTTQSGKVLQVVSTTKTDVFTTASTSFVDVTGLSVSITPSSSSNKILILGAIKYGFTGGASATHIRMLRGSTEVFIGDADGVRSRDSGYVRDTYESPHGAIVFLDSPSTTSSVTYKIQINTYDVTRTATINRPYDDGNSVTLGSRLASTITALEIAA